MDPAPIGLHLRSTVRSSWRALLAIAVLFGLSGGLALASLASARRTDSAYDRLLETTGASDLSIDYGTYRPDLDAAIAALPGVAASSTYVAFNTAVLDPDGSVSELATELETIGSLDGRYFEQDRVSVISGRMPDPTRRDEVGISESAARGGIEVGDELTLGLVTDEEIAGTADPDSLIPGTREPVTVVGEILFGDEVIQDDNDVIQRMLVTPAFTTKHVAALGTYGWQGLRLVQGADRNVVSNAARQLLLDRDAEDPGFTLIRTVEEDRSRVDRAIRPLTSALLIVGLLVALVALVLMQQAAIRQLRLGEGDLSTYRSFGLGPAGLTIIAAVPLLVAIAAGAVVAIGVAIAASPLSPLGALHRVEARPGVDVDALVVVGGAAALAVASCIGIVATALASARRVSRTARSTASVRPSRLVGWARSLGAPVSVSVGTGHALQPQTGPRAAPVRTIAVGTTVAIAALVAALCFGSSLTRLVENPGLYGWNWDVAVIDQAGYGRINQERAAELLDADPDVEGWAPLGITSTDIDEVTVPIIAVRPGDRVGPAILTGRMVADDREIVLGRSTMRTLGKAVGDTVSFGPLKVPLRIVGSATLPAVGQVHSSHPSPGEGAITVNTDSLIAPSGGAPGDSTAQVAVIRFRRSADVEATRQRLEETVDIGEYPGSAVYLEGSRPAEIINARSITIAPTLTAGVLTLTALISLSLALVAAVRRRRVDLATLKAIGLTRRQVGATILTQSLIVTTLGVVIGTPLGIISGRWLWTGFANRLSVVNSPSVPIVTLAIVLGALTLGALLVAVAPSQIAARIRAGDALRRD